MIGSGGGRGSRGVVQACWREATRAACRHDVVWKIPASGIVDVHSVGCDRNCGDRSLEW